MESNNKLKEINIKNCTYYYFHDIIKLKILILVILYWIKNHTERF